MTFKRQLESVSLPALKKYYNCGVLEGAGVQFQLRVLCPAGDARRVQRLLLDYCRDGCVHACCSGKCGVPASV